MDELIAALRRVLATGFVLYLKTHSAHWNVEGPLFETYHELFGRLYKDIWDSLDDIAEKVRQLDAYVSADMGTLTQESKVWPFPEAHMPASAMVRQLLDDNMTMMGVLEQAIDAAEAVDEEGIISFLATRYEAHQKWRWFLSATSRGNA